MGLSREGVNVSYQATYSLVAFAEDVQVVRRSPANERFSRLRTLPRITSLRLTALLVVLTTCSSPALASRICTSGFETNNFGETEWQSVNGASIQTTTVHSGTYAMQTNNSSQQKYTRCNLNSSVTSGTYFGRFYFRRASGTGRVAGVASNGDAFSFTIEVNAFNQLTLTNTADSSVITGATVSTNTWYRVEFRIVISDSVGELELYIDGVSQGSLTGKDTLNTNVQRFYLGNIAASGTMNYFYDDFALNVFTGTFQTSLPGPGKIALVKPSSDNTVTWTKTGANCSVATNTECVDDAPGTPDDLNGYNETSSVQTDRFDITSLPAEVPASADMILMHVIGRMGGSSSTDANTARWALWDESGTKATSSTTSMCDQNGWSTPHTGNGWVTLVFDLGTRTATNVNGFDIGYEPVTVNQTCRATALWANVEWIEASSGQPRRRAIILGKVLGGGIEEGQFVEEEQSALPRGVPTPRAVPAYGVLETGAPSGTSLVVSNVYPWSYSASQPYPACAAATSTTCNGIQCVVTITQPTPAINTDMWIGITGQSDATLNVTDSTSATWDQANDGTVTVNTAAAHNLTTGDVVAIQGPTDNEYIEGMYAVTVVDTDTFTYTNRSGLGTASGTTNVTAVWAVKVTAVVGNDVTWASSKSGNSTGGTICPKRKIHPLGTTTFSDESLNAPRRYLAATWRNNLRPEDQIVHPSSNLQVVTAGSHCNGKRCAVLTTESGNADVYEYAPGQPFIPYWVLTLGPQSLLGKGPTADLLIYASGGSLVYRTLSTKSAQSTKRNFNTTDSCLSIVIDGNNEGHISANGQHLTVQCNKSSGNPDFFTYDWINDTISTKVTLGGVIDNVRPLDNGDFVVNDNNSHTHYARASGTPTTLGAGTDTHGAVTTDSTGQQWLVRHANAGDCEGGSDGILKTSLPQNVNTCMLKLRPRAGVFQAQDVHFSSQGDWIMFNTRYVGDFSTVEATLGASWFNDFPWWGEKIGILNVRTNAIYWLAWSRHSFISDFFAAHPRINCVPPADLDKTKPCVAGLFANSFRELSSKNSSHIWMVGVTQHP